MSTLYKIKKLLMMVGTLLATFLLLVYISERKYSKEGLNFFIQAFPKIKGDILVIDGKNSFNISRPVFLYARHTAKFVKVTSRKINALTTKENKYGKYFNYFTFFNTQSHYTLLYVLTPRLMCSHFQYFSNIPYCCFSSRTTFNNAKFERWIFHTRKT